MYSDVLIVIPSRIGSQRLKNKPLQVIGSKSMIEHVVSNVKMTGATNIYVATDSDLIKEKLSNSGINIAMTTESCESGTDRVYEAYKNIKNNDQIKYIINVQGDMPFVKANTIIKVIESLKNSNFDIMTPIAKVDIKVANSNSNVKVVIDKNNKALYFSRSLIPSNAEEFLYHVGIYGFKKEALEKFVKLPKSYLEKSENLEQLRALENGLDIGICYVDDIPISVDTIDDLNKAIEFYNLSIKN